MAWTDSAMHTGLAIALSRAPTAAPNPRPRKSDLQVAAGEYDSGGTNPGRKLVEKCSGKSNRAARLHHKFHPAPQKFHRRPDLIVAHQQNIFHQAFDDRKRDRPGHGRSQSICNRFRRWDADPLTGFARKIIIVPRFRFDAEY